MARVSLREIRDACHPFRCYHGGHNLYKLARLSHLEPKPTIPLKSTQIIVKHIEADLTGARTAHLESRRKQLCSHA